jgi:hypothetical protein
MNLLYTTVLPTLYAHYTGGEAKTDAKYPFPAEVNEVPDFTRCVDTNDRMKKSWALEQTQEERNDIISMNAALINAFFTLVR